MANNNQRKVYAIPANISPEEWFENWKLKENVVKVWWELFLIVATAWKNMKERELKIIENRIENWLPIITARETKSPKEIFIQDKEGKSVKTKYLIHGKEVNSVLEMDKKAEIELKRYTDFKIIKTKEELIKSIEADEKSDIAEKNRKSKELLKDNNVKKKELDEIIREWQKYGVFKVIKKAS